MNVLCFSYDFKITDGDDDNWRGFGRRRRSAGDAGGAATLSSFVSEDVSSVT